jgi:GGDEF domain-containing protein
VWLASESAGVRISSSAGVASFPTDAKTKAELLHLADEAMYLVKNTTRDNVAAAQRGGVPVPCVS